MGSKLNPALVARALLVDYVWIAMQQLKLALQRLGPAPTETAPAQAKDALDATAFLLRTNKLTPVLVHNYRQLDAAFPGRVFIVADESESTIAQTSMRVIGLDTTWASDAGLYVPESRPFWLNGDYFYYRAAQALPWAQMFWMMDDDVLIHSASLGDFFQRFSGRLPDLFAAHVGAPAFLWKWTALARTVFPQPRRCFFPLSRLSRRAVLALFEKRRELSREVHGRPWLNDEVFVASAVHALGYTMADLNRPQRSYTMRSYAWRARFTMSAVQARPFDDLIYHAVK
jgi:hypothetical protein